MHEDKVYYPSAEEVFGPDVEALVQEEDTQPLSQPIIEPIRIKSFQLQEKDLPETIFSKNLMVELMNNAPERIRNVAIVGHLHHGKTSLLDVLVSETHNVYFSAERQERYTDPHRIERDRGCSIKTQPMSLLLPSSKGTSYVFHLLDTPGHVNFIDEVASAMRLADGIVLVVDAAEGVMVGTERIIRMAVAEGIPMTLLINKVDRLIVELRLPPQDAYFKLRLTIEEVNNAIKAGGGDFRLSPELGNVLFASSTAGWCFSLYSFAQLYFEHYYVGKKAPFSWTELAKRLWGDIFYDSNERKFKKRPASGSSEELPRSFVHFILEPLYKLYSQVLGESETDLAQTLASVGIDIKPELLSQDVKELLRTVLQSFFGSFSTALVDACVLHLPNPREAASSRIERIYSGPMDTQTAKGLKACDPNGPLMLQVTKLYASDDATTFFALGRVFSGTLKKGEVVRILGPGYSLDDEEDMAIKPVEALYVYETRYKFSIDSISAGNIVLLGGVESTIVKGATITAEEHPDDAYVFSAVKYGTNPVMKLAIEPINPSELPKLLDGLRKVNKSYPLLETKVEESGEHVLLGSGEMYMDCVMHDLRKMFAEIDIKVADPVVRFSETVIETSSIKCFAETPNKRNKLTMISEPLEKGLAEELEAGRVNLTASSNREVAAFFQSKYGWDALAARSVWAFGPDMRAGPNVLLDDTLPGETDKKLLFSVKESIRQGFQWGVREGPLCDEPIRSVKFRILDATLAQEAIYRGSGQIIPTARRVCYSSFLMSSPRLMEPVYYVEIQAPADCVSTVYTVLSRRRYVHILSSIF